VLYHLFYEGLQGTIPGFNVFRYITFRALCAGLTALTIIFAFGPYFIKMLSIKQMGQKIRKDGPKSHQKKGGTPTMGGILILLTVVVSTLLWADLSNSYIWLVLGVTVAFGFIGWLDDYKKIKENNSDGLSEKAKLILQTVVAIGAILTIFLGARSQHPVAGALYAIFQTRFGFVLYSLCVVHYCGDFQRC